MPRPPSAMRGRFALPLLLAATAFAALASAIEAFETVETENFRVRAASPALAQLVADRAERHRSAVARQWFGRELPTWSTKCVVHVHADDRTNRGSTSYAFRRGRLRSLEITLRGEAEEIVGTVLPHEVVHAVVVGELGHRPPRWADEGIAMTAEPSPVRWRQRRLAAESAAGAGGLEIGGLFGTRDYPPSRADLLTFYARSYAVTAFLVGRRDPRTFLEFVERGQAGDWNLAARECYDYADLAELEAACESWLLDARLNEAADPIASAYE
jgi:hypothetical protein